jgi:hypothetical protein
MAKIWRCRDGNDASIEKALGKMSLIESEEKLHVSPVDYLCDLSESPRFDTVDESSAKTVRVEMGLPNLRDYKHVVVEVSEEDVIAYGGAWKPGFYRAHITPDEAYRKFYPDP